METLMLAIVMVMAAFGAIALSVLYIINLEK